MLDSTGHQVDTAPTQALPGKPLELRLALLPNGAYTVTWQMVSKTDGHLTGNSIAFGVGQAAPATPQAGTTLPKTPSPTVASVAGKWALDAGVSVLFAAGAVSLLVCRGAVPRGRRTVIVAWLIPAIGYVLIVFAERSTLAIPLGTLLNSGTGRPLVDLAIAIAVAALAVILAAAGPVGRPYTGSPRPLDITATARDGTVLQAHFSQSIG